MDQIAYLDKFQKVLVEVDINKVKPNEWNPNRHDEQSLEVLKRSIKQFGFNDPISVRQVIKGIDEYQIIDGEHRLRVCKDLGFTKIVVINFGEVTRDEAMTLTQLLNHGGKDDVLVKAKLMKELRENQPSFFELLPGSEKEKDATINLLNFDFSQYDAQPGEEEQEEKDDIIKVLKKLAEVEVMINNIMSHPLVPKLQELLDILRGQVSALRSYLK